MPIPDPRLGLVIHYAFLWSHEHGQGAAEGRKNRPCGIVAARRSKDTGKLLVRVLPITHLPPRSADSVSHLKLTEAECRAIALDGQEHRVLLDEMNEFSWPGYDLRPIPGSKGRFDYGMLPEPTFRRIIAAVLELDAARKAAGKPSLRAIDRDA